MANFYHEDIVDIELSAGSLHRSFCSRAIGSGDKNANRFGVRLFRDGVPVTLLGSSCQGFFRNSQGENIALTSHGTISGNVAYITLPQACYNYDGNFTLAIKIVNAGDGVTGTMRIVDGVVDNTNTGSAVAPTSTVPTYQEIIAQYDAMVAATEDAEDATEAAETIADTMEGRIAGCEDDIARITGKDRKRLNLRIGRYYSTGYSWTVTNMCVADGFLEAGTYDLPKPPEGYYYCIVYYNTDSSGDIYYAWGSSRRIGVYLTKDSKINFMRTDQADMTDTDLEYLEANYEPRRYWDCGVARDYVPGVDPNVLKSIYIPDVTGWTLERVSVTEHSFRIGINMPGADAPIINGDGNADGVNSIGTTYSDAVQRLIDPSDGSTIGYYILHYPGTNYTITGGHYAPNEAFTSNLSLNPAIDDYMCREGNLVLLGDSIFGYQYENRLQNMLSVISDKKVYNGGFGGCTMAVRSGSNYNPFCFARLADCIAAGDFSAVWTGIGNLPSSASSIKTAYTYRYADLCDVDWSKPTTIFVDFVNNDLTAAIPIGDAWSDGDTTWDDETFLGAMTYGISKILTAYPHIRIVFMTNKWRYLDDKPPYEYENASGLKAEDYSDAMKTNAERIGISVYDFLKFGGSNAFNKDYMMISGASHFTPAGHKVFADLLNRLDHAPIM